jgi:HEAT repeat protein
MRTTLFGQGQENGEQERRLEKSLGDSSDVCHGRRLCDRLPAVSLRRAAAVLALMEFRSEKTIEALREALKDKDFEVRMYAEEALKKIETRGMR